MGEPELEIELKFLCAPEHLDAVLAAAPPGEDRTRTLASVYFDTPDAALAAQGVSLRVRESGGAYLQTLKRGEGMMREEHEAEVAGPGLDLALPPLPELLGPEARAALAPVSRTHVVRRQRLLRYGGAAIELALDLGEVTAGGRSAPISEVELELKAGPREALFDLGRELARAAPLTLSSESKSARGRTLGSGT